MNHLWPLLSEAELQHACPTCLEHGTHTTSPTGERCHGCQHHDPHQQAIPGGTFTFDDWWNDPQGPRSSSPAGDPSASETMRATGRAGTGRAIPVPRPGITAGQSGAVTAQNRVTGGA